MVLAGRDRKTADTRLLQERTDADARLAAAQRDADERLVREAERSRVDRLREMQVSNLRALGDLYATRNHLGRVTPDASTIGRMVMLVHLLPPEVATCMRDQLRLGPPLSQAMKVKADRYHQQVAADARKTAGTGDDLEAAAVWLEMADDVDLLMTGTRSVRLSGMYVAPVNTRP